MEALQPPRPTEESLDRGVPRESDPKRLPGLIDQARSASPDDQPEVAELINDLLVAMRAPGNEAAEAKAVLAALDASTLDGLVDGRGRNCRAEAVETLLACGFPHALQVTPEELEHNRDSKLKARSPLPLIVAGAVVAVVSVGLATLVPTGAWHYAEPALYGGAGVLAILFRVLGYAGRKR